MTGNCNSLRWISVGYPADRRSSSVFFSKKLTTSVDLLRGYYTLGFTTSGPVFFFALVTKDGQTLKIGYNFYKIDYITKRAFPCFSGR